MWIMGIGCGKLLSIWEFIIPASAGLSDELKTSVVGGQECNIARPDPISHSERDAKGGEVVMLRRQPPGYRVILAHPLGLMRFAGDIPVPVNDLDSYWVGFSASGVKGGRP